MTDKTELSLSSPDTTVVGKIGEALLGLIASIPSSEETLASDPAARGRALVSQAAIKSAVISGSLALPPGPLGMLTVLPDLYAIWRVQAQLVADIAAVYGKTAFLTQEAMLICLFKHAVAQAGIDLMVRTGQRILIKRAPLRVLQQVLARVGTKTTQRMLGRGIARWLPIVGALGIAGYAYYDTRQVGQTAIELFSNEIEVGDEPGGRR